MALWIQSPDEKYRHEAPRSSLQKTFRQEAPQKTFCEEDCLLLGGQKPREVQGIKV